MDRMSGRMHNRYGSCVWLAGVLLWAGGCGVLPKGHTDLDVSAKDRGVASWYGEDFHGKLAADGRPFDMHALTAAHRSLPLGSVVRVLNAQNGRSVLVRITDRGPYVPGRVLDLSYEAAARLGMLKNGLSPVLIDVVGDDRFLRQWMPERIGVPSEDGWPPQRADGRVAGRRRTDDRLPLICPPEDLWGLRRLRRVSDVFAANHYVDRRVASLMVC